VDERQQVNKRKVSDSSIRRLAMYLRTLDMLQQVGVPSISSKQLAQIEDVTPAQVRKDLSCFGSFGRRGLGYDVAELKNGLTDILGLNRRWNVVLIGAGHFSAVMMHSKTFRLRDFTIRKIFDPSPELAGNAINGVPIRYLGDLEKDIDPEQDHLAIIALPPPEVQAMVDRLGRLGVKGVLYFASRAVDKPQGMAIRNQDMSLELAMLTYEIAAGGERRCR
jgi:redox-sensing transcriptional repressor